MSIFLTVENKQKLKMQHPYQPAKETTEENVESLIQRAVDTVSFTVKQRCSQTNLNSVHFNSEQNNVKQHDCGKV